MNNMDLIKQMPEMLSGKELYERLADIPVYDETIREKNQTERLMALSTLYDIYLPSEMSVEIYSKLYLALLRSLQKKGTHAADVYKRQIIHRYTAANTDKRFRSLQILEVMK